MGGVAASPDVGCARSPADFTRNDVAIGTIKDSSRAAFKPLAESSCIAETLLKATSPNPFRDALTSYGKPTTLSPWSCCFPAASDPGQDAVRADDADVLHPLLPPAVQAVVRPGRPEGGDGQPVAPGRLADAVGCRPDGMASVGWKVSPIAIDRVTGLSKIPRSGWRKPSFRACRRSSAIRSPVTPGGLSRPFSRSRRLAGIPEPDGDRSSRLAVDMKEEPQAGQVAKPPPPDVGRHRREIESRQVHEPPQCGAARLSPFDGPAEVVNAIGARPGGFSRIPGQFVGLVDLAVGAILGEDRHSKARSVPAAGEFDEEGEGPGIPSGRAPETWSRAGGRRDVRRESSPRSRRGGPRS